MQFNFSQVFAVGQRVRYLGDRSESAINRGEEGTIVSVLPENKSLGVNWDRTGPARHDCCGKAHRGHGWYVYMTDVTLI